MKRRALEQSVIFISVVKWFVLATLVGIAVGVSTTIFLKGLEYSISTTGGYKYYFLLLPAAFFLSSLVIKYIAPEAEGHGTEKVIESIHKRSGKIKPLVVPIKLVATILTIASGGSAGKEGPCAQIGAGISSSFATLFKFNSTDRKKLVICGISAGFATVFGTPIAGAIFGVEVLFVGALLYDVLLPSFIAGIVGYQVSSMLGITYFHQPIEFVPVFTGNLFLMVCISGIVFGIFSFLFIELIKYVESINRKLKIWPPFKAAIGGTVLVILTLIFSTQFLGLGLETIEEALKGNVLNPLTSFGKMLFTSITLSFGGSGGIVTPIFFIGATSGSMFATFTGLDLSMFAAIGMVALLAGATNTPISASIMALELFGSEIAPYAAVACVISFLITGHRSVYPSQVLSMAKSSSIQLSEKNSVMEKLKPGKIRPRPHSILDILIILTDRLIKTNKKMRKYFIKKKKEKE